MSNPTVEQILADWLEKHGYSGLYWESECGCCLDNFMPCREVSLSCQAGYKVPNSTLDLSPDRPEFLVVPEKTKEAKK